MSSTIVGCGKCGGKILASAPQGLCTICLLKTGLSILAEQNEALGEIIPGAQMQLGDYELLEEIGRGGQGVVYRARQKSLNRTVALKVIGLGHWATRAHVKRFRLEAEAAARLDHPCIVPIHEVGESDGSCYFSMQLVEGGQLDEVLKREPLPIQRAVELIAKLARTVHYAHEHGILHRDIKPGNILVDGNGEPHLTDFGLARLIEKDSTITRTLELLGTPSYMAPEQAMGNALVTSATDVYGLGAVFYQLLTGHPPFAGGTTYETVRLVVETEPRQPRLLNPKVDRDLATICLKCLEKDPQRRYSSALALAEDLERSLRHEPIQARRTGFLERGRKSLRRNPTKALLAMSLIALAAAAGWIIWKSELVSRRITTGIAVLPFEDLSKDKENAYFADGVHDDILTKLAQIGGVKVISRTSVMSYRGAGNARQIGDALRVSHVLEGSVRRFGERVRVNAQLIDTRNDAHLWAEQYDRNLNDVFAIQSDIAQKIAEQLRATISESAARAMAEPPTRDLVAYDLYVHAQSLIEEFVYGASENKQGRDLFQAVELLNQAITRDAAFLLAYCRLAEAHDELYFQGFDHTPSRLESANSAIDSAFRLKPDSGEAHLARALHLYHGYFDYDHARDELGIAVRALPNNARIFEWSGYIDRRQGRWHDALRNFERATELDPKNVRIVTSTAATYGMVRKYNRSRETLDRLIVLEPNNNAHRVRRAWVDFHERADPDPVHAILENQLKGDPQFARERFLLALYERDGVAADRALAVLGEDSFNARVGGTEFSRACAEGLVARMKGDDAGARAAFSIAREQQEQAIRAKPDNGLILCMLGLIDAGLGRKEEALQEGRRALELTPVAKDSQSGADVLYFFAVICAWVDEHDVAIEQLKTLAKLPAGPSYGNLRLSPYWDPLRGDPRFEKIVASLAPR